MAPARAQYPRGQHTHTPAYEYPILCRVPAPHASRIFARFEVGHRTPRCRRLPNRGITCPDFYAKSSHPNGQVMPEHVSRVPPCLDLLQARVIRLVVQYVPRYARGIQGRVCAVNVRMIDEGPIVGLAWNRDAAPLVSRHYFRIIDC